MRARALLLALVVAGCGGEAPAPLSHDGSDGDWPLHGRTPDEQRHSPLGLIHRANVGELGLAWSYATGTRRGLEATPIVIDGVMYATGSWSVVFALDAASGRELWRFDPQVPGAKGRDACCDVVNRGVAVANGRVYVGSLDGRLIALHAQTGAVLWEVQTVDPALPYTITGAPRLARGLVIIGNGGAEYGVRGYVSAYDARTGELAWRFYTVPASKQGPHEHPELEAAARTWPADALWESGLGGTVWDSIAFDPELDLLYVGTGNSSVYNRALRSPGGGDNLYLSSILALRPDTGELVWHYQTTPGEAWDYTATQHMILADLEIGGRERKVLMQAPKNGFFYVLDRETGELLSAEKFAYVSWATHVDPESGRPVERAEADWSHEPAIISPAVVGAHNWHPMSFDPATGLVYIPAIAMPYRFEPDPDFEFTPGTFNTGEAYAAMTEDFEAIEGMNQIPCGRARTLAWNVAEARPAWEIFHERGVPGGALTTAGGLLFQGADKALHAYDASTGERLWSGAVGIDVMAPPVTYSVGGEQYVAVLAGAGGAAGLHFESLDYRNDGRILAWKLGGTATPPPVEPRPVGSVQVPPMPVDAATLDLGRARYAEECMRCHGGSAISSGLLPDLRWSSAEVHANWDAIVLGGARASDGMASFADLVTPEESRAIHAYVIERGHHEPGVVENLASFAARHACIPVSWMTD